jgi:pimeloyl-ACP methyl ester carboxylesterase
LLLREVVGRIEEPLNAAGLRTMYLLGAAAALYGLACTLLLVLQRSLIYYPAPRGNPTSSLLEAITVGSGTVNVSVRPRVGVGAVVYFGGNAEDVSRTIPDLAEAFPSSSIYAMHYPGYGGSSGQPSERTIFAAALACFDRVRAEHPHVVVIGRSLGSGVAVYVASRRPVARLVLVTPFDSFADAAAAQYPLFPVRWLLRDKYESWRYAPRVQAPTRLLVPGDDELVPRSSSERLRTRFHPALVDYVVVPGHGHNTIQDSPGYWALISRD